MAIHIPRGPQSSIAALTSDSAEQLDDAAPLNRQAATDVQPTDTFLKTAGHLRTAFDVARGPVVGNSLSRLITDNRQAWVERWDAMATATSTIDAQYFAIHDDVFGLAFIGHLLRKQLQGVESRLLTDAMADSAGVQGFKMHWGGKDYLQELVRAGGSVGIYNPINTRLLDVMSTAVFASNHDKILVMDKARGFTGGRNIGHDYFVDSKDMPEAWRDTDILIEGRDPARSLTDAFELEFNRTGAVRKVGIDLLGNWIDRKGELLGAYLMMDLWLKDPPFTVEEKAKLRESEDTRLMESMWLADRVAMRMHEVDHHMPMTEREMSTLRKCAAQLVNYPESRGSMVLLNQTPDRVGVAHILDQSSTDGGRVGRFAEDLQAFTLNAKKKIRIENPYLVLTESMIETLEKASANGVQIELITNSPLSTDSALTQAFFLEEWAYVMARVPTLRIFVATGERKLHAKTATFDDILTLVSTYNLDILSGEINSEVGAAIWSEDLTADTNKSFDDDIADPKNGFVEYMIQRDADGHAVLHNGEPIPTFGPDWHLSAALMEKYDCLRKLVRIGRKLPMFNSLDHPPLTSLQLRAKLSK